MKNFLILGAGTGGTMVANKMAHLLDPDEWRIIIVDKHETHYYQPGLLFIPFDIYTPDDVVKPKRDFIPRNVEMIMSDIIATGIDAKHSFEDKILPVEQAYQRWGKEIGIIGGLDMDLITRGSEEDIRRRTREILDVCGPEGGYALGTGNSVADYVPARNFMIMVDEGRKWNQEHFPS